MSKILMRFFSFFQNPATSSARPAEDATTLPGSWCSTHRQSTASESTSTCQLSDNNSSSSNSFSFSNSSSSTNSSSSSNSQTCSHASANASRACQGRPRTQEWCRRLPTPPPWQQRPPDFPRQPPLPLCRVWTRTLGSSACRCPEASQHFPDRHLTPGALFGQTLVTTFELSS